MRFFRNEHIEFIFDIILTLSLSLASYKGYKSTGQHKVVDRQTQRIESYTR